MKARRGIGLGTTLIVVALVATLGFIVASASVNHLQLMARSGNQAYASDLARSAVALALDRVFAQPEFGAPPTAGRTVTVHLPGAPEGSLGVLTFDPAEATALEVPVSTNNLQGAGSVVSPSGQTVPTQACHLVAVGRCRGVTRQVEVILARPPFPYAIVSEGPIVSLGGLLVGSLDPAHPGPAPEHLQPADLQSNAAGAGAIQLGPDSLIKGDVRAHGEIELNETEVLGQVLAHQDPRSVPRMQVADYDPGSSAATLQPHYGDADLTGRLRASQAVAVDGDLRLQGALLYVDGDLTVDGSLLGSGIVVTTGRLTVRGQAEMASSDKLAILARQGIQLEGKGKASSSLRGVVYTEGGLSARQLRLEGALVAHGGDQEARDVQLNDVAVVRDPAAAKVSVAPAAGPTPLPSGASPGNLAGLGGTDIYIDADGHVAVGDIGQGDAWQRLPNPLTEDYFRVQLQSTSNGKSYIVMCRDRGGRASTSPLYFSLAEDVPQDHAVDGQGMSALLAELRLVAGTSDPSLRTLGALQGLIAAGVQARQGPAQGSPAPAQPSPTAGPAEPGATVYTVDPSSVLPLADAARIMLWRER